MEPTVTVPPVSPAPAKKTPVGLIIAVIAGVVLSLCCCCPGILVLSGQGTWATSGVLGEDAGTIDPMYGLICVGAAIIPLFIPVIVFLVQKSKK